MLTHSLGEAHSVPGAVFGAGDIAVNQAEQNLPCGALRLVGRLRQCTNLDQMDASEKNRAAVSSGLGNAGRGAMLDEVARVDLTITQHFSRSLKEMSPATQHLEECFRQSEPWVQRC